MCNSGYCPETPKPDKFDLSQEEPLREKGTVVLQKRRLPSERNPDLIYGFISGIATGLIRDHREATFICFSLGPSYQKRRERPYVARPLSTGASARSLCRS